MQPVTPLLYAAAATLAAPGLRVALRLRERRGKEIGARLGERRGIERTPRPPGQLIWVHAASVGETVSVLPVLASVATKAPELTMLLTTGTVTSARLLAARLPDLGLQGRVLHRFVPLDVPAWAGRFLEHWRPDAACLVESELWPNLLAACQRRGVPLMLMNARLSPRSHARWRRMPAFARMLLQGFDRIEARSEDDAERLCSLGAREVGVPGDLKFAAPPLPADDAELARLRAVLNGRPVWLAASTHAGEDEAVLDVHRALAARHPGVLTIIVPRHPERGRGIVALAAAQPVARRAAPAEPPPAGAFTWPIRWASLASGIGLPASPSSAAAWFRMAARIRWRPARLGCAMAAGPLWAISPWPWEALERAGGDRPDRRCRRASPDGWMPCWPIRRAAARWARRPGARWTAGPTCRSDAPIACSACSIAHGHDPARPGILAGDGGGLAPWLLRPLEGVTARLTAARVARPGWHAPVPVFCCGNAGSAAPARPPWRSISGDGWRREGVSPAFPDARLWRGARAA